MIAFIDDHREAYGVEPICKVLPIAPSTYHEHAAKRADPAKLSARAKRDVSLKVEVRRVFAENFEVYGVRKVRRQLRREGFDIARYTVERLMRGMGLRGVTRGKPVRTTVSDKAAPCPLDHVKRQFRAPRPNVLWVSDFTYVATWQGFVYVAFVIDTFARRIVGWRASRTAHTGFVLDALEQELHDRRPVHRGGLVHHSDRGSQGGKTFISPEIMISKRPAEAADRAVPGHWEGDLILGLGSSAIGTLVERKTRYTLLLHLPRMTGHGQEARVKNGPALAGHGAEAVRDAITRTIITLPEELRRSLTWDQGAEMAQHAGPQDRRGRAGLLL
jgi:putative transposase